MATILALLAGGDTFAQGPPSGPARPIPGTQQTTAPPPRAQDSTASTRARDESFAAARPAGETHEVRYRVDVRTDDAATAAFPDAVHDVLTDPRGWIRAGYEFVRDPQAPFRIVIAEGAEVDRLCHPYDTGGRFSCQNGAVVAINADRWRGATAAWPGDLEAYRTMLVNHEVGHLLHLHHPEPQCPEPGLPAPVMAQQSSGPGACRAHSWPLQWEIDLAAERREPLAPGADHDPSDHLPEPPPARR